MFCGQSYLSSVLIISINIYIQTKPFEKLLVLCFDEEIHTKIKKKTREKFKVRYQMLKSKS